MTVQLCYRLWMRGTDVGHNELKAVSVSLYSAQSCPNIKNMQAYHSLHTVRPESNVAHF